MGCDFKLGVLALGATITHYITLHRHNKLVHTYVVPKGHGGHMCSCIVAHSKDSSGNVFFLFFCFFLYITCSSKCACWSLLFCTWQWQHRVASQNATTEDDAADCRFSRDAIFLTLDSVMEDVLKKGYLPADPARLVFFCITLCQLQLYYE